MVAVAGSMLSEEVDFLAAGDDALQSKWLHACQLHMAAESGLWDRAAWRLAADAWADVARACPPVARQDIALFWRMAGDAARRAR